MEELKDLIEALLTALRAIQKCPACECCRELATTAIDIAAQRHP